MPDVLHGEVCRRLIGSGAGTFPEFRNSLVLAGALAGLGFGLGEVRVGERVGWVHQFLARHQGICIPGIVNRVWTVDFLVAALGLVLLALF